MLAKMASAQARIRINDQLEGLSVETVLRNMAVRAAHEVAWMREETAEIEDYAIQVARQAPDSEPLGAALRALADAPRESLHLRDVVEHGSLLVMAGTTQHRYRHGVPKTKTEVAPRINLTFRRIFDV